MDPLLYRIIEKVKNKDVSLDDIPDKMKEKALFCVASQYLEASGVDKDILKKMHGELTKGKELLGVDSALGRFSKNPEECAKKMVGILEKYGDKKLNGEKLFNMVELIKNCDLEVLENCVKVGEKLSQNQEKPSLALRIFSVIASNALKLVGFGAPQMREQIELRESKEEFQNILSEMEGRGIMTTNSVENKKDGPHSNRIWAEIVGERTNAKLSTFTEKIKSSGDSVQRQK